MIPKKLEARDVRSSWAAHDGRHRRTTDSQGFSANVPTTSDDWLTKSGDFPVELGAAAVENPFIGIACIRRSVEPVPTTWLSSERSLCLAVRGAESLGRRSRAAPRSTWPARRSSTPRMFGCRLCLRSATRRLIARATLQDPDCQATARCRPIGRQPSLDFLKGFFGTGTGFCERLERPLRRDRRLTSR